jgi:hypothetical protein
VKTLYKTKLDEELLIPLKKKYPALFEEPKWIIFLIIKLWINPALQIHRFCSKIYGSKMSKNPVL